MESLDHIDSLAALAHPGRMAAFRLLARHAPAAMRPSQMAEVLDIPRNTLSVHVSELERAGLVLRRREGRSVLYSASMARMGALIDYLAADCCRGRPDLCAPRTARALLSPLAGEDRPLNVLFLCSGNSARSIIAEAILRREGGGRFKAFSAGTRPYGAVRHEALKLLRSKGYAAEGLRSKDITEFQGPDAPAMDFVFTVCDRAADEECPPWPGLPLTSHWGVADPAEAADPAAFEVAFDALQARIRSFLNIPFATLDRAAVQGRIDRAASAPLQETT